MTDPLADPSDPRFQLLLAALRCPESKQTLRLATEAELQAFNHVAATEGLRRGDGEARHQPLEAALVREDGTRLYPIEEGFPILLLKEALEWKPN